MIVLGLLVLWLVLGTWYAMYNLGEKPYQTKLSQWFDFAIMAPVFAVIFALGWFIRFFELHDD